MKLTIYFVVQKKDQEPKTKLTKYTAVQTEDEGGFS